MPFVRAFLSAHNDFHQSFPSNNWAETTPAYDLGSIGAFSSAINLDDNSPASSWTALP